MADINLLPKEFRSREAEDEGKVSHQLAPNIVFTNPTREKDRIQLTKEVQGGWRYALKNFWQKFIGKKPKVSTFEKIAPATASRADFLKPAQPKSAEFKVPPLPVATPAKIESAPAFKPEFRETRPAYQTPPAPIIPPPAPKPITAEVRTPEIKTQPLPPLPQSKEFQGAPPLVSQPTRPMPPPPAVKQAVSPLHQVESPVMQEEVAPGIELEHRLAEEVAGWSAHRSEFKAIIWTLVLSILVVIGGFVGVYFYGRTLTQKTAVTNAQIESISRQITLAEQNKNEALSVQQKLKSLSGLLSKHIYWTQAFKLIEDHTLNEVYYTSFSGSTVGTLTLHAIAPDFVSAARQLKIWQGTADPVISASAMAFNRQTTMTDKITHSFVSFDLNLQIKPSLFEKE